MIVLVVLVLAALVVGIGGIIKGILWAILIGILLVIAAAYFGWRSVSGNASGRR